MDDGDEVGVELLVVGQKGCELVFLATYINILVRFHCM